MNALFILNAAPYGSEHTYNGLRLAGALAKREKNAVRVFLMGDAVASAKHGQKVPEGYYNLQLMLHKLGADNVGVCGSCLDARGIDLHELAEGLQRGTLEQLADWSEWADKVFVF